MDPFEYQQAANRTECSQQKSLVRIKLNSPDKFFERPLLPNEGGRLPRFCAVRLIHGVLGLQGEVGELAGALEKWLYYGQELDQTNLKEEIGDCLWYLALVCNAMEYDMGSLMRANIEKLKKRFPDKFCEDSVREENRDREKEAETVEIHSGGNVEILKYKNLIGELKEVHGSGFAEPSEERTLTKEELTNLVKVGFNVAREVAMCFAVGQDQPRTLRMIDDSQKDLLAKL